MSDTRSVDLRGLKCPTPIVRLNEEIRNMVDDEELMSYISFTLPGIQRGPHEHVDQADLFCFIGPSTFNIRLWDNRPDSPTFNHMMSLDVGDENPMAVVVPKGVVHGYKNIGRIDGMVINCPNRLYMGDGKREPIDEIRHEDDPDTIYRMEDSKL